jgi:hypothetical protein
MGEGRVIELKVGSTVWIFDENRRRYAPDGKGGPIWREHWAPVKIIGETSRSWVTDYYGRRLPKKRENFRSLAYSEAEIDKLEWLNVHRWRISDAVRMCDDADIMQKVAELVNYKPRQTDGKKD